MKNANDIINDPIKSTLFGKFYEKIVLGWLKERCSFTPFCGKPRIYWKDVGLLNRNDEQALRFNEALDKYKKERQFCTPDGFLQKEGKFYIWEAKNWPLWSEGKTPLNQLRDVISSMPLFLATKGVYKTQEYNIDGLLFSWWSKPGGSEEKEVDQLLQDVRGSIAPRTFELFYTAEILEECIQNQYSWYLRIIDEEQARIVTLFEDLLGR
ncbi:MAG: hypothetical protein AB6733_07255 [Clostridiaceae bacterium]